MGIKRLFTLMKDRFYEEKLENLRGTKLGIDGMGWLYQVFFSVNETEDRIYIPIVRKMEAKFRLLQSYGIKFIVIIDGKNLDCKSFALEKRKEKREYYTKQAKKYEEEMDVGQLAVYEKYSMEVTSKLVYLFIDYLKHKGFEYLVAPYEADSQLAYMLRKGEIDYVATEDSDFFAMSCFNVVRGIRKEGVCTKFDADPKKKSIQNDYFFFYNKLEEDRRILLCILTGCDYSDNIRGIGFITLLDFFYRQRHSPDPQFKKKLTEMIFEKAGKQGSIELKQAFDMTHVFKHQIVYDIKTKSLTHSKPYCYNPDRIKRYIGTFFHEPEKFSKGELDFETHHPREKNDVCFEKLMEFINHVNSNTVIRISNLCAESFSYDNFRSEVDMTIGADDDMKGIEDDEESEGKKVERTRSVGRRSGKRSERETTVHSVTKVSYSGIEEGRGSKRVKNS